MQLALYGWSASFPDAYDYVSGWMTCASIETGYNDGGYCNERIDELVAGAEALPKPTPSASPPTVRSRSWRSTPMSA